MNTLAIGRHLAIIIAIILSVPAHAQSLREANVQADWVDEGYDQNVPVSGRIIIGTMFLEAGHPSGDTLYVAVSSAASGSNAASVEKGSLCLELMSRDGSYKGIWKTALPELEPPYLLKVQYTTREQAFYESGRTEDLVALAALKDNCAPGETTQRILPVAWTPPTNPHLLRVFINSNRMRTLLAIPFQDQGVEVIECEQIQAPQKIAFDRHCDINIEELGAEREPRYEQAALLRYRGPNRAPVVPFPLSR